MNGNVKMQMVSMRTIDCFVVDLSERAQRFLFITGRNETPQWKYYSCFMHDDEDEDDRLYR